MRVRLLKPETFKDEVLASCPPESRLLFMALWLMADHTGRVKKAKAILTAFDLPWLAGVEFFPALEHLRLKGFVEVGMGFVQVNNWAFWQPGCRPDRPGIPKAIRLAVFARDGAACLLCGSDHRLSLDHVIPYSKGGKDTFENLRVLCLRCNIRRGNRG